MSKRIDGYANTKSILFIKFINDMSQLAHGICKRDEEEEEEEKIKMK